MRIAMYTFDRGPELSVVVGARIAPISRFAPHAPKDLTTLMERWDEFKSELSAPDLSSATLTDLSKLSSPIMRPGKILAIGLNYKDHIVESGLPTPTSQIWFCKHLNCVNGPYADVQIPKVSTEVDYEVELVVVIGKRGRHISREEAPAHVFGYTVGNDVSVRDWQWQNAQWMLGKSFDTHAPLGPWIVSSDEVGDPHALHISSSVNGETRQQSNTRNLLFDIWAQISHLSSAMTLEVGDILFTGTPGGVGFGFKPPRPLIVGDTVRCEIEKIGAIENRMVAE